MTARAIPVFQRFWALPTVLCAGALVISQAAIALDQRYDISAGQLGALVYGVGADGSRDLLGAVASSVLTAAATTFSITVAVLALTSSSYGPRLVRNFMADRANQLVLGTFLATFLYALLVLRSVQDPGSDGAGGFVPHLAVNLAVVAAVVDIAMLVFFIHHISESIQISTLSERVRDELRRAIEHLYPAAGQDGGDDASPEDVLPAGWRDEAVRLTAKRNGYLASVDSDQLMARAERHDLVIVLTRRPGDHIVSDDEMALVLRGTEASPTDDLSDLLRPAFVIDSARTPTQDVRFATSQLTEIAVRALSPGTNDPFTAVNALDDLSVSLAVMASRSMPSPVRRSRRDGRVRLIAPGVELAELLQEVFGLIRTYARTAPTVLRRAVALAVTVGTRTDDPLVHRLLTDEVSSLLAVYEATQPPGADLEPMVREIGIAVDRLRHQTTGPRSIS